MAAANVAATGIKGYRSQVAAMAKRTAGPTKRVLPRPGGGDTIPGYPEQAHEQARPIETEGQPGGDEEAGAKSDVQRIFGDRFVGHRRYSAFAFTVFWVIDLQ